VGIFKVKISDGAEPFDSFVFDGFGTLYRTTLIGGIHSLGTVLG
jgi:hypothetical protein